MDLMERIRSVIRGIDFEYEVELVSDGKYGGASGYNKIWNGMIGEVVRGKADVAAGPLTVTDNRKTAVAFTTPFMSAGIQALALNTEYIHHNPFLILRIFTIDVWFVNGFIFVLTAIMIWAFNRLDPYEWREVAKENEGMEDHRHDFSFKNSLWFCASTLFLQSSPSSPRSNAGRSIAGFWWLFVLVIFFLYIVNLTGFVKARTWINKVKDINSLESKDVIYFGTTFKGTDNFHVFKQTEALRDLWHQMNNDHGKPYVKTLKDGVQRVRDSNGGYVLLGQAPILRYIASQKPCDVDVTGAYLLRTQYAFAVAKDSPLAEHLSSAIEALRDSGVLEDLERDWWDLDDRANRCRNQTVFERSGAYSLLVNDLSGFYYLLAIGIGGSIVVFLVEFVFYNYVGGNDKGYNQGRAIKKPKKEKKKSNGRYSGIGNGRQYAEATSKDDDNPDMWI